VWCRHARRGVRRGRQYRGADRTKVHLQQLVDGRIVLGHERLLPGLGSDAIAWAAPHQLPFENAETCPMCAPDGPGAPPKHEFVRVGVVVLVVDGGGHVLITRRAPHMRTFPRAWVCPGGGQDPGEALPETAARELYEEVGIQVSPSTLQPLCLWESVFPTTAEECAKEGVIKGHHLITFFVARLPPTVVMPLLSLQESETDAYMWCARDKGTLAAPE